MMQEIVSVPDRYPRPIGMTPVEKTNEISIRDGHYSSMAYVTEFLNFLYERTYFKFENFTTPRHLQRLADELSFNRIPMAVWKAMLSSALRLARMSQTMGQGLRQFGAYFIDVLVWLTRRLADMGIVSFALFLMSYCVNPLVRTAIVIVTYTVIWLIKPLWTQLSLFIQSRLISAPYHSHFAIMP